MTQHTCMANVSLSTMLTIIFSSKLCLYQIVTCTHFVYLRSKKFNYNRFVDPNILRAWALVHSDLRLHRMSFFLLGAIYTGHWTYWWRLPIVGCLHLVHVYTDTAVSNNIFKYYTQTQLSAPCGYDSKSDDQTGPAVCSLAQSWHTIDAH